MKKVYLELTNRCNLNCIICYRKAWHEDTHDMSDYLLDKCINEINNTESIKEVVLGGIGEPVFAKKINEVVEKLGGKKLLLTTNGTLMSDESIACFVKYIDEIVISIDGLENNFQKIRGVSLKEVLSNIEKINKLKKELNSQTPKIAFQMVITSLNYKDITPIIDLADEYNVYKVIYSNIVPAVKEDEDLVMYKMYDKEPLASLLLEATRRSFKKSIYMITPEVMLKTERRCKFIDEDAMVITVDGYTVPCYRLAHDGSEVVFGREKEIKAHQFGNVKDLSISEIWNLKKYKNYRSTVYNNQYPSCIDCDLVDGCDMVNDTDGDCFCNQPSCGDCLWSRKIVYCI